MHWQVRAGESEAEAQNYTLTNPVAKTSMSSGLSRRGRKQVEVADIRLLGVTAADSFTAGNLLFDTGAARSLIPWFVSTPNLCKARKPGNSNTILQCFRIMAAQRTLALPGGAIECSFRATLEHKACRSVKMRPALSRV